MKKWILMLFACMILLAFGNGQALWNKSIDYNNESNYGYSVLEYNNNEYAVAGVTYSEGSPSGLLLKVDNYGEVIWEHKLFFGNQTYFLYKAFKVGDSQIWTTGLVTPGKNVDSDPAIIVYFEDGTEMFRNVYDFSPYIVNFNNGIRKLNDSTIIIHFNGYYENGNGDYFHSSGYLLTDTLGNEKERKWIPSNFDISLPLDIVPYIDGGYVQTIIEIGQGEGIPFEYQLTLNRLDDTFGLIWKQILPYEDASPGKIAIDKTHNIYLSWTEDPLNPGVGSPWGSPAIVSYNSNGDFRWKYNFDDNPRLRLLGNLVVTNNGNVIAVGLDEPGFDPLQWGWMICLDSTGQLLWDRKYTMEGISPNFGGTFGSLIESIDSSLLIVGYIHDKYPLDNFIARENIWLLKTDLNGCTNSNECDNYNLLSAVEKITLDNTLLNLYPNPTNDYIFIEFNFPTDFLISAYSLDGVLVKSESGFGKYSEFSMNSLPCGIYFIYTQTPTQLFINTLIVEN